MKERIADIKINISNGIDIRPDLIKRNKGQ